MAKSRPKKQRDRQRDKNRERMQYTPTIAELPLACTDESVAVDFIERQRWGEHPTCAWCLSTDVYKMADAETGERNKRFLWRCRTCKRQYTVRVGTVLEDSRIPLRHWCFAFWRASTSKKGVAALEIQRQTGLSYKSCLFLLYRIRFAMKPEGESAEKMLGDVEVDECFVGGKPRFRGADDAWSKKTPVLGILNRGGRVRCRTIERVSAVGLKRAINEVVDRRSRLLTDELKAYRAIGAEFEGGHETVSHGVQEYVRGDVTTNTVEGFFATIKRGINGIYHHVSKHRLPLYLAEYEFRYNHRDVCDGERVTAAIRATRGKKLFYREPVGPFERDGNNLGP